MLAKRSLVLLVGALLLSSARGHANPKKNGMEQTDSERIADEIYDSRAKQANGDGRKSTSSGGRLSAPPSESDPVLTRQQYKQVCELLRAIASKKTVDHAMVYDILYRPPWLSSWKEWGPLSAKERLSKYRWSCPLNEAEAAALSSSNVKVMSAAERRWRDKMDANNARIAASSVETLRQNEETRRHNKEVAAYNAALDARSKSIEEYNKALSKNPIMWFTTRVEFERDYKNNSKIPPQVLFSSQLKNPKRLKEKQVNQLRPAGFDPDGTNISDPSIVLTPSIKLVPADVRGGAVTVYRWKVEKNRRVIFTRLIVVDGQGKNGRLESIRDSYYCHEGTRGVCLADVWKPKTKKARKLVLSRQFVFSGVSSSSEYREEWLGPDARFD